MVSRARLYAGTAAGVAQYSGGGVTVHYDSIVGGGRIIYSELYHNSPVVPSDIDRLI